jgi:hypothetical protein
VSLSDQEKAAVFARVAPDLIEQGPADDRPPSRIHRWAHSWGLVVALVAALLGLAGSGTWLYVDHHQTSSEQAVTAAARAWLDAANTHDLGALGQATSGDWTWQSSGPQGQVGPFSGPQLASLVQADFAAGLSINALSRPAVSSDTQVAVTAHVTGSVDSTGVLLFNLRTVKGELKVAQVIWVPSR